MRTAETPPWAYKLPYVSFGAYALQLNVTVTPDELLLYQAHAIAAGKPFDVWANETLVKYAELDLNQPRGIDRKVAQIKGPATYLRFNSCWMARDYYRRAAKVQGFKQTSKWVRWTLNREVAL